MVIMVSSTMTTNQLVHFVNELRLPMRTVECRTGLTRQGIYKRLKKAGVLIPRRAKDGAVGVYMSVRCAWCQEEIKRRKKQIIGVMRSFCNESCYYASLETSGYIQWRQGSRIARAIVAKHFPLEREHVVHHQDGDQRNNVLDNLAVFESNAVHMAHHRGRKVVPLWDGAHV